ncbi:hypothetical protein ES703_66661 [subsurface metagenome]
MALIDDLVSYYKLDEIAGTNADDAHGANDGTATDARVFTSEITGIINTGADFTQGADHIDITGVTTGASFSIMFWFNSIASAATMEDRYFIDSYDDPVRVIIDINNGYFSYYDGSFHNSSALWTSYNDGEWHQLIASVDGTNVKMYIDNVSVLDTTVTSRYLGGIIHIADRFVPTGYNHITAYLDEIGIWTKALDSSEVTALWNDGNGLAYPFAVVTNMKMNILDIWKDIEALKINISNAWKNVIKVQQNIGNVWKDVFG